MKVISKANFRKANNSLLFTQDIVKEADTKAQADALIAAELETRRQAAQGATDELVEAQAAFSS